MAMPSRAARLCAALAVLVCLGLAGCADTRMTSGPASAGAAVLPGPRGAEGAPARQQHWLIPSSQPGLMMNALLYRPPGEGPFRLAVINHGSDQNGRTRAGMALPAYPELTGWLVARGYAVLVPQRPGHGQTGGPYIEDQLGCDNADFAASGRATADSIMAAIDFMTGLGFVRGADVLVLGHSAGGWGALALAARNPAGIAGIVNFSGGRGGRNFDRPDSNCAPDRLAAAAAEFGRSARVPTLWLYAENDSYFGPALSRRLAEAFRAGGGAADYRLLPPVGGEGHALIQAPAADGAGWAGPLAAFLSGL